MFKTIFWKQFFLYMGTLILSFAILGISLSQALNGYFVTQKKRMLEEQGEKIATYVVDYFRREGLGILSIFPLQSLRDQLQILHTYVDTSFVYIDNEYKVVLFTTDVPTSIGEKLDVPELKPVMEGEVVSFQGRLMNIYSVPVLTVAHPVLTNDGRVIGAVLLNSSMPELQRTTSDAIRIILMCLFFSGTVAFVLVSLSSRSISRPLREMNDAAKEIASGDFEKRITVYTDDEVGQLGMSFNNMAESLYYQDKMRSEFISNVSHDIRSPLTSMRGFLQAILDGTIPEERVGHYLNIVMGETERLTKLANDILDLNKIQSFEIALLCSNFDINELLRSTILMFEPRCRGKEIAIELQLADEINVVHADYEKVQRIVYNLLDNAVKFTPVGGQVTIETTLLEDKVLVHIKDSGQGIAVEDQKRIFDRFYKGDASRGEDKMGSGLGLAIVRAFVKAHEENITLTTEEGKGSVFSFSLPLAVPDELEDE